jgi:peroxiredoxin
MSEELSNVPEPKSRSWLHQGLLMTLLTISVALNGILSWQVWQLKNNAPQPAPVNRIRAENKLPEGASVPAIEAVGLNKEPITLEFNGGGVPSVLYVFSPKCQWCDLNLENVKALAKMTDGKYRFIGLSLLDDKLQEYIAQHKIEFPVYSGLSRETRVSYKLGSTPQTIVVSPDGQVLKNWSGAYSKEVAQQVEEFFNVRLPGLAPASNQVSDGRP